MKLHVTNLLKPFKNRMLIVVAVSGLCFACSDDDSDGDINSGCVDNFNWVAEVSDEAAAFTTAATTFANNQTQENCDAYENAALAYIDALEDAFDCVRGADRDELEAAADEARADIAAGICD